MDGQRATLDPDRERIRFIFITDDSAPAVVGGSQHDVIGGHTNGQVVKAFADLKGLGSIFHSAQSADVPAHRRHGDRKNAQSGEHKNCGDDQPYLFGSFHCNRSFPSERLMPAKIFLVRRHTPFEAARQPKNKKIVQPVINNPAPSEAAAIGKLPCTPNAGAAT